MEDQKAPVPKEDYWSIPNIVERLKEELEGYNEVKDVSIEDQGCQDTPCNCKEILGNDFYFLPMGECLFRKDNKMAQRDLLEQDRADFLKDIADIDAEIAEIDATMKNTESEYRDNKMSDDEVKVLLDVIYEDVADRVVAGVLAFALANQDLRAGESPEYIQYVATERTRWLTQEIIDKLQEIIDKIPE